VHLVVTFKKWGEGGKIAAQGHRKVRAQIYHMNLIHHREKIATYLPVLTGRKERGKRRILKTLLLEKKKGHKKKKKKNRL